MTNDNKTNLLETSKTLMCFILVSLLFGVGMISYYNGAYSKQNKGYEKRQIDLENVEYTLKGKIINIQPNQVLFTRLDGNNIVELGRNITYHYKYNSKIIEETDSIQKNDIELSNRKILYEFKIEDSINIGMSKQRKSIILFDTNNR